MMSIMRLNIANCRPLEAVMDETEATIVPHILSEQEIMHKYWKISMNVRLASVALQRELVSLLDFCNKYIDYTMCFCLLCLYFPYTMTC